MDAQRPDPDDLRDLLAAYRDEERLPAARRAAAWRDLQADLHTPPLTEPRRTHVRPLVVGAALLAAALALLVIRPSLSTQSQPEVVPQAVHAGPHGPLHPVVHAPVDPPKLDAPVTTLDAPDAPPIDTTPISPSIDTPRRREVSRPAPAPTPAPIPDLERELALLRAARDALAHDDTATAMAALADHAKRFPSGLLREERLLLRVEALCAAGDVDAARDEATSFASAHPASPHAKKILRICP